MRVKIFSIHEFEKNHIIENYKNFEYEWTNEQLNLNTVELAKGFDAITVFSSDKLDSDVLYKLNDYGIKYISTRSVGFDHINLSIAHKLGLKVANVPEYSPYSVAEFTLALIMMLNRNLFKAVKQFKDQDYRLDSLVGFDLHNKTVGIIGAGKIGSTFAKILNGFGAKILVYDIEKNRDLTLYSNLKYVDLDYLYANSDIISLSLPLNNETKYLINKDSFKKMIKKPMIINTARGAIINTTDLIYALENQLISSAALDVFEREKGIYFHDYTNKTISDDEFHKLNNMDNVLMTSHQAFLTKEALSGIASTTNYNLNCWLNNKKCENEI